MRSSTPGFYPRGPAASVPGGDKNSVSRHCQTSAQGVGCGVWGVGGRQNWPWLVTAPLRGIELVQIPALPLNHLCGLGNVFNLEALVFLAIKWSGGNTRSRYPTELL